MRCEHCKADVEVAFEVDGSTVCTECGYELEEGGRWYYIARSEPAVTFLPHVTVDAAADAVMGAGGTPPPAPRVTVEWGEKLAPLLRERWPLHSAAKNDRPDDVRWLVGLLFEVDARDAKGRTPFYIAMKHNALDAAVALLELGAGAVDGASALHTAMRKGLTGLARRLLASGASIDAVDDNGLTPLDLADRHGQYSTAIDILGYSFGNDRDPRAQRPLPPMHAAAKMGLTNTMRLLLSGRDSGAARLEDISRRDAEGSTPLDLALESGSLQTAIVLLQHGAGRHALGDTPLHVVARMGLTHVARLLLDGGKVSADAVNSGGETALDLALALGHVSTASLLIQRVARAVGATALHVAAERNLVDVARRLIRRRVVAIDAKDGEGRVALHIAAKLGHVDFAIMLLGDYELLRGIGAINSPRTRCNIKDKVGWTPLHYAARFGQPAVVKKLRRYGANATLVNTAGSNALRIAATAGHVDVLKLLTDWEVLDAIDDGALGRLRRLIREGADVTGSTSVWDDGMTPLHRACATDAYSPAIVRLLIAEGGAKVGAKDRGGRTPLHWLARMGHWGDEIDTLRREIARLLIDRDAALVDARDNEGRTALMNATAEADVEFVRLLVDRNSWLDAKANDGRTALIIAAARGFTMVSNLLLARGAAVHAAMSGGDYRGWTAMHFAARLGGAHLARQLIEKGAVIDAKSSRGWTALHVATMEPWNWEGDDDLDLQEEELDFDFEPGFDNVEVAGLLLEAHADSGAFVAMRTDDKGKTAMHLAAERHLNSDYAALLLAHGADVNAQDNNGDTPLMLTAQIPIEMFEEARPMVEWLLDNGAAVDSRNEKGTFVTLSGRFRFVRSC